MPPLLTPQVEANLKDLQNSRLIQALFINKSNSLLNEKDLVKVAKAVKRQEIPPHTRIFEQGSTGLTAGILIKGKLYGEIAYKDLENPITFSIEKKGELYGEISLVTGLKRCLYLHPKRKSGNIGAFC